MSSRFAICALLKPNRLSIVIERNAGSQHAKAVRLTTSSPSNGSLMRPASRSFLAFHCCQYASGRHRLMPRNITCRRHHVSTGCNERNMQADHRVNHCCTFWCRDARWSWPMASEKVHVLLSWSSHPVHILQQHAAGVNACIGRHHQGSIQASIKLPSGTRVLLPDTRMSGWTSSYPPWPPSSSMCQM